MLAGLQKDLTARLWLEMMGALALYLSFLRKKFVTACAWLLRLLGGYFRKVSSNSALTYSILSMRFLSSFFE